MVGRGTRRTGRGPVRARGPRTRSWTGTRRLAGPDADDTRVDHAILECVARYGGSISAEHGVGRAKAGELHLCRSVSEIAAMRAIKRALDPAGLMNPGVLLEG